MAEILKCSPQRILVAPGEYETTQEINAGAIEVVGESPETTFLSLNNGYNGKIILSGTMFSGITVRNYDNRHSPASGGVSVGGTTVISNCVFTGFRHDWGLSMLTVSAGTAKLIDTVFRNANSAAISYTGGNASFERCVISNQTSSAANCGVNTTLFRNCLIAGNTGSGITASGTLIVENTTIVSNANGIVMSGSGLAMTNAIIAANMTADVTVGEGFTASIANSCFAEADSIPSGAVTVSKSLAADPMFNFGAKKKLPYYGILGASPCKNTGVNAAWMDEATDLAGNRRRVGMVDMGCYEHPTAIFVITVR